MMELLCFGVLDVHEKYATMVYSEDTTTILNMDDDDGDDKMVILSGREVQKYFDGGLDPLRKPLKKSKPGLVGACADQFKKLFGLR